MPNIAIYNPYEGYDHSEEDVMLFIQLLHTIKEIDENLIDYNKLTYNCTKCRNCYCCINCENCIDCIKSYNCKECYKCNSCINCYKCKECEKCVGCVNYVNSTK